LIKLINTFQLKGHEGVIFNIHFIDYSHLVSVSDDRTTRYWSLDYKDNSNSVIIYQGHNSRVWDAKIFKDTLVSVSEDCTARVYNLNSSKCIKELPAHQGKNIRAVAICDNYIFTGGEDNLLIKWNRNSFTNESKANPYSFLQYNLRKDDEQTKIALSFQKNFNSSIKVVKIIPNELLIGTNHGVVLRYTIGSDFEDIKTMLEDKEVRVINSLDYIAEIATTLVGLSDGQVAVIDKGIKYLPIFHNIRIPFKGHKIISNKLFLFISNPLGLTKIYFSDIFNLDLNFNNYLLINTGGKASLPISCAEIIELTNNEYLLMLGDLNGVLNYCNIKVIYNKLYLYTGLRGLCAHNGHKVSNIVYDHENDTLFTTGRDGNFKNFVIRTITNKFMSYISLIELDCKNKSDITSIESFHFVNMSTFLIGHYGKDLKLYDLTRNFIFHTQDVKGTNRPFDICFKDDIIYYCYSQADTLYLMQLQYNPNQLNQDIYTYTQPVHGRLIHSVLALNISADLDIVLTASEDTKIYIYRLVDMKLLYLEQITKHSGAIRQIVLVNRKAFNNRYEIIISSVGAYSECYLFKLIIYTNAFGYKDLDVHNLCDLSIKCDKLDTRNMSIVSQIMEDGNILLLYTNTLLNSQLYLFNFKKSEYKPYYHTTLRLKRSNFIALTVDTIIQENKVTILYGLTNGNIYIQKTNYLNKIEEIELDQPYYKIHEAGINELRYIKEKKIIITCGEDNSIAISKLNSDNQIMIISRFHNFHSSPVKSINLYKEYIISGGYDQKLNILQLTDNELHLVNNINTCVAEINSIALLPMGNTIIIIAVGQGIELFKLNKL
jgi:WD40 repeat protein